MTTTTYITLGSIVLLIIICRIVWTNLTKPPRPMVRYIKGCIEPLCEISQFDSDLTGYLLPRPDDQLGGGLYKKPERFGFRAKYSFSHRSVHEKLKQAARFARWITVSDVLRNVVDDIDEFEMTERSDNGQTIQYHVTLSSTRVRYRGASHCRVAVTVAYRLVPK